MVHEEPRLGLSETQMNSRTIVKLVCSISQAGDEIPNASEHNELGYTMSRHGWVVLTRSKCCPSRGLLSFLIWLPHISTARRNEENESYENTWRTDFQIRWFVPKVAQGP